MDKASYEIRLQQWIKIIQEANASGLQKQTWCSQNGISARKFYYWHKKVRDYMLAHQQENCNGCTSHSEQINAPAAPVFYEVQNPAEPPEKSGKFPAGQTESVLPEAVIRYDDFGIFVGSSISEKTLTTILSVIRNA